MKIEIDKITDFVINGIKFDVDKVKIKPILLSNIYKLSIRNSHEITFKPPENIINHFYGDEIEIYLLIKNNEIGYSINGFMGVNADSILNDEFSIIATNILEI